jgi:triosephosphate isomerase
LGAQNISEQKEGAYTGEISAEMAAEFCSYVLLGHSERRAIFYESDDLINQKIQSALSVDLIPVLCVGELLEERESGQAANVISRQLQASLNGVYLSDPDKLVIAYEPIWAIGSGKSASANDTGNLIGGVIRPTLAGIWDEDTSQKIRVLYGGSVNPGNARGFFSQSEIDGALVGGASLSANNFLGIIEEAK